MTPQGTSPAYAPTSPPYVPTSPPYQGAASPAYAPTSPPYYVNTPQGTSPAYAPTSPPYVAATPEGTSPPYTAVTPETPEGQVGGKKELRFDTEVLAGDIRQNAILPDAPLLLETPKENKVIEDDSIAQSHSMKVDVDDFDDIPEIPDFDEKPYKSPSNKEVMGKTISIKKIE